MREMLQLWLAFVGGGGVQLLTQVQLIETPCIAAYQAPLFISKSEGYGTGRW